MIKQIIEIGKCFISSYNINIYENRNNLPCKFKSRKSFKNKNNCAVKLYFIAIDYNIIINYNLSII